MTAESSGPTGDTPRQKRPYMPTAIEEPDRPSAPQLWRATTLAALTEAAVPVTIVMPAEYGLDPTGLGRMLGLFRPASPAEAVASVRMRRRIARQRDPLRKSDIPFQSEETSVLLQPGEGTERKAVVGAGR